MPGDSEEYQFSADPKFLELADSLLSKTITSARVLEHVGIAFVELRLNDGRTVQIGVHGSLYDEAYLVFGEA